MDQNTTNINELPIDPNPPENREMPIDMVRTIDRNIPQEDEPQKQVQFDENISAQYVPKINKQTLYEVSETNKIIILSTLIFLLFNDGKVKNYIISILFVFFGDVIKTQTGGISKSGLVAYSLVFGLSLYVILSVIEIVIHKYS
jgi:hypothetical protein